jgi:PAS domain S-box-containing protein
MEAQHDVRENYLVELEEMRRSLADVKALQVRYQQMAEALRRSENTYRTLLENLPQKIFHKDRDSVYVSCNENFARDLRLEPCEIIGKTDYDFFPWELAEKYREDDRRVISSGQAQDIIEKYIQNDRETWVQTVKTPVKDGNGSTTGILGIFWDVTERKQSEEALQQAHQALEDRVRKRAAELEEANRQLQHQVEERGQAEEELRISEQKYRTLFDNAADLIAVVDTKGDFLELNKKFEEESGYRRADMIGQNLFRCGILTESSAATVEFNLQKLLARADWPIFEIEGIKKDGGTVPYELRAVPIESNGDIVAVQAILRNITERRRSEEALRQSEEKFRLLAESIQDVFWMSTDRLEEIIYLSPAYEQIWGRSRDSAAQRPHPFLQAVHPEDRQQLLEAVQENGQSGWSLEYRILRPEGSVRWIHGRGFPIRDECGRLIRMCGICTDITERKEAEEQIRRLGSAVEQSIDGIAIADLESKLVYVNEGYARMHGFSAEEMIGMNLADLHNEAQMRTYTDAMKQTRTEGGWRGEIGQTRKDGTHFPTFMSVTLLKDSLGKPSAILAFARDVTEQKKLQAQFQHAQKMEAIGTLAGGIAHDFNNLLQAIQGYTELLLLGKDDREPGYRELREILHSASTGGDLTRQLLTFSRKVESNKRPLDLNQQVIRAERLLARTIPKMIDIDLRLAEHLRIVSADPAQIQQVLMNLGVNARDAMPEGGTLALETADITLDREFCRSHLGAKPGHYVVLAVSDTGHGMDRETMERVFEPFFSNKGSGKGTGLGLAIVYGIVKNHGGHITCSSTPGEGTSFKLYLPAIEQQIREALPSESQSSVEGGSERILLVDDERAIRQMGAELLTRFGYTVSTAASGEEALALYQRQQGNLDLVILDLIMPGMGGRRCLDALLRLDPQVRVLIASGYSVDEATRNAIEDKAKGFVRKPFQSHKILASMRQALA